MIKKILTYLFIVCFLLAFSFSITVYAETQPMQLTTTQTDLSDEAPQESNSLDETALNVINLSSSSSDDDDDFIESSDIPVAIIIGLVIGLITAFVVTGSMVSAMNTARKKKEAKSYIRPGSLYITQSYDNFLYENTTKTAKPQQNK